MPRILVVDDEPLISMLVEDWLVELGCEVVGPPARSSEAWIWRQRRVDGAILDINFGGNIPTPWRTLEAKGVPFAFATGDRSIDPSSGFADPILLSKPFDFEG